MTLGRALRASFAAPILGGAAFLVSGREYEPSVVLPLAAASLGAWVLFLLVEKRLDRAAPRLARALDIVVFDLALVLFLTEASLRVLAGVWSSPLLATVDAGAERVLAHSRRPAGVLHWAYPTNRGGHYDEEFTEKRPGETLVACIGDSFSFSAVPHYWHYTTICERLLPGTRIHNLGAPGVGPPEYEILLTTEALPLRPDVAVIAVFVGNDVAHLGSGAEARRGGLRSWLDRGENRTWTLIDRLARIRAERLAGGNVDGEARAKRAPAGIGKIDDPEALDRRFPWLRDPALEKQGMSEDAFLAVEVERARDGCAREPAVYASFFASMQAILDAAGRTPIGVLLLPDQFQVDDELWSRVEERLGPGPRERDRPQRLIGAWLAERGVPFVDLLPRMRLEPLSPEGSRNLYVRRNTHFNLRGNAIAAACLAELVGRLQARR